MLNRCSYESYRFAGIGKQRMPPGDTRVYGHVALTVKYVALTVKYADALPETRSPRRPSRRCGSPFASAMGVVAPLFGTTT